MPQSSWVHLEGCEVKRLTDKAILVHWDGEDLWIPKSQIGSDYTVSVTEWFANKNGIEG